jgi:DNA polymerase/3'-5' exonuclease PolX
VELNVATSSSPLTYPSFGHTFHGQIQQASEQANTPFISLLVIRLVGMKQIRHSWMGANNAQELLQRPRGLTRLRRSNGLAELGQHTMAKAKCRKIWTFKKAKIISYRKILGYPKFSLENVKM